MSAEKTEKKAIEKTVTSLVVEGHDALAEIRVGKGRAGSTAVKKDGTTEVFPSKGAILLKYKLKEVKSEGGAKVVPAKKKAAPKKAAPKKAAATHSAD